jgi:hypothetical protein
MILRKDVLHGHRSHFRDIMGSEVFYGYKLSITPHWIWICRMRSFLVLPIVEKLKASN